MQALVFGLLQHFDVDGVVVLLVLVDVMNALVVAETTADLLFGHDDVFENIAIVQGAVMTWHPDRYVAERRNVPAAFPEAVIRSSGELVVASLRAEFMALQANSPSAHPASGRGHNV